MAKGTGKLSLHAGMKNRSAKAPSEKPKGGSVNSEPTRSKTAPTPRTLGPRNA